TLTKQQITCCIITLGSALDRILSSFFPHCTSQFCVNDLELCDRLLSDVTKLFRISPLILNGPSCSLPLSAFQNRSAILLRCDNGCCFSPSGSALHVCLMSNVG
ncbi:hypothetical protein Tcan_00695, partial [Toxocara canis]